MSSVPGHLVHAFLQVVPGGDAPGASLWAQVTVTDHANPAVPAPWEGDTWGMSEPAFVRLFAVALVVTAIVAWVLRWRLDARRPWMRGLSAEDLTPAELAYLSSGRPLVALTVEWALWRAGVLRIENTDVAAVVGTADEVDAALLESPAYVRAVRALRVSLADDHRGPDLDLDLDVDLDLDLDLVERAAVDIVAAHGSVRPHALTRDLRRSPGMDALEASLQEQGYVRSSRVQNRMMLGVVAVFTPLALVGLARFLVGLRQSESVGNLLVLLTATLVLFVIEVIVTERPATVTQFVLRTCKRHLRDEAAVIDSLAGDEPTLDEARALAVLGVGVLWHANPVGAASLQAPTAMLIAGSRVSMVHGLRIGGGEAAFLGTGA